MTIPQCCACFSDCLIQTGLDAQTFDSPEVFLDYAREHAIPCLGLCLGLQTMVIEFARNVAGLAGANSAEFDGESPHRVIDLMDEQREVVDYGGTMRLGVYPAKLDSGSQVAAAHTARPPPRQKPTEPTPDPSKPGWEAR